MLGGLQLLLQLLLVFLAVKQLLPDICTIGCAAVRRPKWVLQCACWVAKHIMLG